MKTRIIAVLILLAGVGLGFFVYSTQAPGSKYAFKAGLDLAGGTLLTYSADVSGVPSADVGNAMNSLRDVIERRVNVFGVSEPVVQVEEARIATGKEQRLIVELPGVTDIDAAIKQLGKTPMLEFRLAKEFQGQVGTTSATTTMTGYVATGLTGRFLKNAQLQFNQSRQTIVQEPIVALTFNDEGTKLFADITSKHLGERLAIFLDGEMKGDPTIQATITDGKAIITGLSADEAKEMARNLNFGALPVPITLVGADSVGASLGKELMSAGVQAGLWGFLIVALFMIFWYRLPGLVAVVALALYTLIMLALFKLVPVTLTAAGIAGFILTIGIAVDANVLIFERMKEELRSGKNIHDAIAEGFSRAWLSIRDGNMTTVISAIILFYTTTSLIKGFALTLLLGVIVSMFTAISITRTLLLALAPKEVTRTTKFLFGSGVTNA
ncbi:protein translocase subunit SecD [Candidatus Campbellbacteria bacterium]|nr:MAG: protein translocase subunit SecD [Candidatus Campbellbacteria bacterium]